MTARHRLEKCRDGIDPPAEAPPHEGDGVARHKCMLA